MIELTLPWPPTVNTYYRYAEHRILISSKGRAYRQMVCSMLRGSIPMLEGPIEMTIKAYPPDRRRRDLDNILKCLLDSLQHGRVYRDDSQVKILHTYMDDLCRPNGKVIINLKEID